VRLDLRKMILDFLFYIFLIEIANGDHSHQFGSIPLAVKAFQVSCLNYSALREFRSACASAYLNYGKWSGNCLSAHALRRALAQSPILR